MTPQEETKVMQMTRQERMAHFGRLLGSKTITWEQYAYIINLSDTPSRKEETVTQDEFVESLKFQDIITVMTAG